MDQNEITAWIEVGKILVVTGIAAWDSVAGWIRSNHPQMTEAELNQIAAAVQADAARRQKLAEGDSGSNPT